MLNATRWPSRNGSKPRKRTRVPVWMLVVRNVKPEALVNIDSGNARNTADMLTITGISEKADAKDVAAIAQSSPDGVAR